MNSKQVLEIAIANVMDPTEEYLYRKYCRTYSNLYYTPLDAVYRLNPDDVFRAVYEHQLEQMDEEDLEILADKTANPDRYQEDEDSFDREVRELEAKEKAKFEAKQAKAKADKEKTKQSLNKAPEPTKGVVRKYE